MCINSVSYWAQAMDMDEDGVVGRADILALSSARYGHGAKEVEDHGAQYALTLQREGQEDVKLASLVVPSPEAATLAIRAAVWETCQQLLDLQPGPIQGEGPSLTAHHIRGRKIGPYCYDLLVAPASMMPRTKRPFARAPGSPTAHLA
jgi:hypothetical protein